MGNARPFWGAMEARREVAAARSLILCLDFDGTLAHLQPTPATAQLDPQVRTALENLAHRGNAKIAIVSGRQLPDLRVRVGLRGVTYAAEYGMEIQGGGLQRIDPGALESRAAMQQLAVALADSVGSLPGVLVEEK